MMKFTAGIRTGNVVRLPILHPNDPRVPPAVRQRYGGRRCVIWLEGDGPEGSIVAGGIAPPPLTQPRRRPARKVVRPAPRPRTAGTAPRRRAAQAVEVELEITVE
jgi:hypothetical protein